MKIFFNKLKSLIIIIKYIFIQNLILILLKNSK